jgi:catechol 2,3-dioxygenase-like lactoylglutathione lyase family enzyme
MITKLTHVTILVKDYDKALEFCVRCGNTFILLELIRR